MPINDRPKPVPIYTPPAPPLEPYATQSEITAIANRTSVIEQRIEEHTDALEPLIGLDETGGARIGNVEARLDVLESPQYLAGLDMRITRLEEPSYLQPIYERLDTIESPTFLETLVDRITRLEEQMGEITPEARSKR